MEELFCVGGPEGVKIVFSLLSLTLRRRAGEEPGRVISSDITGLPLATSLYDLCVTERREEFGVMTSTSDLG